MEKIHSLRESEFEAVFQEMTDRVAGKVREFNLQYTYLAPDERDRCLRQIMEALLDDGLEVVGEHRHEKWEKGWTQNLEALRGGEKAALVPHYFKKDQIARWRQEFIRPTRAGFDYAALTIILEWLFEKYMKDAPCVYEFGCGTGHHLLQLQAMNPGARLYGLDWAEASQKIIAEMVRMGMLTNTTARRFDFFDPDLTLQLEQDSVVYTVAALEQVGQKHGTFVDYLLDQGPRLCVHVEPIAEVLDPSNLLDYLSVEYFRKRRYLWGFLERLRDLEQQGAIRIHKAQRTFLGGNMFVDHYSVVVWSPLDRRAV